MRIEPEIAIVNASVETLNFMAEHPSAESEEILKHVINNIRAKGEIKLAAIAAADKSIKMRVSEPGLTDRQIIQKITDNVFHIMADVREYSK